MKLLTTSSLKEVGLLLPILLLTLLTTQIAHANTVATLKEKGDQCIEWAKTRKVRRTDVTQCLVSCRIYSATVEEYPDQLTEEGIKNCDKQFSKVKNKVARLNQAPPPKKKAPDSIADMAKMMEDNAAQWQNMINSAPTSAFKRQAESCYQACARGNTLINRPGINMSRAESTWRRCIECKAYDERHNAVTVNNPAVASLETATPKKQSSLSSMPDIEGMYLQKRRNQLRVRADNRADWKKYCNESAIIKNGKEEFLRQLKPYDQVRFIGVKYDPAKANKVATRCTADSAVIVSRASRK